MTGNVTPLALDVIKWETSKTLEQEFPDFTVFNVEPDAVRIQKITYRKFGNKSITNYIIWNYELKGFITFVATDTVFLECNNFDNAETLIDEFVRQSYKRFSDKFDELKKQNNIRFALPPLSEAIRLNYRNKLIETLRADADLQK
ncbi:hypothetical protein [Flavisolibacter nicotianae]|uniref:hypothetical protein n=1 Tax=Flavisolibacter nicotianae TaxID=2364882 RepID=UPI000EACA87B|nr:hypothetical protein [Flavisolibacter nicotianae]